MKKDDKKKDDAAKSTPAAGLALGFGMGGFLGKSVGQYASK